MEALSLADFTREFAIWVQHNQPDADASLNVVEKMAEYKTTALGSPNLTQWSSTEIAALTLDVLPFINWTDPHWLDDICATLPLVGRFLQLSQTAAEPRLAVAAREAAYDLATVFRPAGLRYSALVSFMFGALTDGPFPDRTGDVNSGLARVSAEWNEILATRPFDEIDGLIGPVALPLPDNPPNAEEIPPLGRIAPLDELAVAAQRSVLISDIVRLSDWLCEQSGVLRNGRLVAGTAERAVVELNWSTDLPMAVAVQRFHECWRLASVTGFVDRSALVLFPGLRLEEWRSGSGAAALVAWARVTEMLPGQLAMIYGGEHDPAWPYSQTDYRLTITQDAALLLAAAYVQPLPTDRRDESPYGRALNRGASLLARHGALNLDASVGEITPLGAWWVISRFEASGLKLFWQMAKHRGGTVESDPLFEGGQPWPASMLRTYSGYQREIEVAAHERAAEFKKQNGVD